MGNALQAPVAAVMVTQAAAMTNSVLWGVTQNCVHVFFAVDQECSGLSGANKQCWEIAHAW
jgi:hypothetical protein